MMVVDIERMAEFARRQEVLLKWQAEKNNSPTNNSIVIVETLIKHQLIKIVKNDNDRFDVYNNDILRHPNCDAEAAMRALAWYSQDDE